jgi:hypothetical protein
MSEQKIDRVSPIVAAILRLCQPLTEDERRKVAWQLLGHPEFGCDITIKMFLYAARAEVEAAKNIRRSRPPSKEIQERNDGWLGMYEGMPEKPGKSLSEMESAIGLPLSTIRNGLKEARNRREEARALKQYQDYIVECRKRVASQLAGFPDGKKRDVTNSK